MTKDEEKQLINKKLVKTARLQNESNPVTTYSHPTSTRIRNKCIDLSCKKPLHDVKVKCFTESSSDSSVERWLEAYLIQKARKHDWKITLAGCNYQFLYSQLKFRLDKTTGKVPTLDLLLYEPKNRHLVVIELKRAKSKSSKSTAEAELVAYLTRLKTDKIKRELEDAFGLGNIGDVKGYIVWPKVKIERPWEVFRKLGNYPEIQFDIFEPK